MPPPPPPGVTRAGLTLWARLRASLENAKKKNDNACSAGYAVYILPGRQEHGVLSSRKKRLCDGQAATIMKAHVTDWERNRECSVKSFDTSLLRGGSTRVETGTKWENGRGKGNWKIAGAGEDGKGRRSARSAFFFPDSRRLIPALPKFCSLYHPFHAFFPLFGFSTVKETSAEEREYLYPC